MRKYIFYKKRNTYSTKMVQLRLKLKSKHIRTSKNYLKRDREDNYDKVILINEGKGRVSQAIVIMKIYKSRSEPKSKSVPIAASEMRPFTSKEQQNLSGDERWDQDTDSASHSGSEQEAGIKAEKEKNSQAEEVRAEDGFSGTIRRAELPSNSQETRKEQLKIRASQINLKGIFVSGKKTGKKPKVSRNVPFTVTSLSDSSKEEASCNVHLASEMDILLSTTLMEGQMCLSLGI